MQERFHLSDLSILFICPSKKWGTLERRCLQDSIFIRDTGGNPMIYCLRDSHLDHEASLQDIPRIYYSGSEVKKSIDFHYFRDLKNCFKNDTYDIVHCYSLRFVWSICFLMMRNRVTPLILTFNRFLNDMKQSPFRRWLLKRVDLLVIFSETVSHIVEENLPIPKRKIRIFGAGIELSYLKNVRQENERVIGSFIPRNEDSFLNIFSLIYSILPLKEASLSLGIELKFVLFCEKLSQENENLPFLMKKIEELGLGDKIELKYIDYTKNDSLELDLLVGLDSAEPFNDLEIRALLAGIPIVVPRTASRQNLVFKHKWVGETYKKGDSREMKDKILKILSNEQVYLSEIEDKKEHLLSIHGVDHYNEELGTHYERLYLGRKRLESKKLHF